MEFQITAATGESVTVHSENWMMALGKAMGFLNIDPAAMVRWVCTPGPGGQILVEDPVAELSWSIKPIGMVVRVVASTPQREVVEEEQLSARRRETEDSAQGASDEPPPLLNMPMRSNLEPPPMPEAAKRKGTAEGHVFSSENLAERLFDLSMDIGGGEPDDACQRALDLILELVPCEAGSVARGQGFGIVYVAATGPIAEAIKGRTVEFGQGLVGLCFEAGIPIEVSDAQADERHEAAFDEDLGFETRAVLCVPITHDDEVFGVVQLFNPEVGFDEEHVEVARTIARTLATALAEAVA